MENLKDHIAKIEELLLANRGTARVESTMNPMKPRAKSAGMSLEQISATRQWKSLSTKARQVLSLHLGFEDRSLVEAVGIVHPELTHEVQRQVAENLSVNPEVKRIISLFFGRAHL